MVAASVPAFDAIETGRARRFVEGTAAVAVWVAIGLVFQLSANGYLLVGIPITILFQRYVRRAPLRAMWVRSAPPFRLGRPGVALAILLMIQPLLDLVRLARLHGDWIEGAWLLVAVAGAWAASYALRCFHRETWRELLVCIATAGTLGIAILVGAAVASGWRDASALARVHTGITSLLQYIPVTFVLEEVWFRGVLDSHLHHPCEARGTLSAIYVSALWGVWHVPITSGPHRLPMLAPSVLSLLLVHIPIGVFLSRSWRRSGNLFVPGSVHALIDAVRNALIGFPA